MSSMIRCITLKNDWCAECLKWRKTICRNINESWKYMFRIRLANILQIVIMGRLMGINRVTVKKSRIVAQTFSASFFFCFDFLSLNKIPGEVKRESERKDWNQNIGPWTENRKWLWTDIYMTKYAKNEKRTENYSPQI